MLLVSKSWSQQLFNKIYDVGYLQNNASAIIEVDNHYIVAGNLLSKDSIRKSGIFFSKFDENGQLLKTNQILDESNSLFYFLSNNKKILELRNHLYVTPFADNSHVFSTDFNLNEVLELTEFEDPMLPDIPNGLTGITEFPKGQIAVAGVAYTGPTGRRGLLAKIDPESGETDLSYIEMEGMRLTPFKLITTENNTMLALGYGNNGSIVEDIDTATVGIFVIEYDESFNKIQETLTSEALHASGYAFDAIVDSNQDIVVAAVEYIRDTINSLNEWQPRFRPAIVKLNKHLEYQWSKPLGQHDYSDVYPVFHSLVESHDQDGYIIVGEDFTYSDFGRASIIMKMSSEGDSIWYKTITTLASEPNDILQDIIKSSDGNYVSTGLRARTTQNDSIDSVTQLWLIKFDENGDLIDLSTSSDTQLHPNLDIKIFPNPSSDVIYIEQKNISNIKYQLFNAAGQLLIEQLTHQPNHSYILDVSQYQDGIYHLHVTDLNSSHTYTKKILVQH